MYEMHKIESVNKCYTGQDLDEGYIDLVWAPTHIFEKF